MIVGYLHHLKNILFREYSFILRYYLHHHYNIDDTIDFILMVDGKMVHGGLFDRLKGAISIYAISKVYNKRYGLYFTKPFHLDTYLIPNLYDWRIKDTELYYSYPKSRPVIAYSELNYPKRLLKERKAQTHFYFGGDIIDIINNKFGTSFEWAKLYGELFKPSDFLQKQLNVVKREIGADYYAIHLRFLNLLGDMIEPLGGEILNEEGKKELAATCLSEIKRVISIQPKCWKPVVFSDSMSFLSLIKVELPDVSVVSGNVRHIDNISDITEDDHLKVFTDMYLMVGAQKVYSIVGKGMHSSAFPEYSAKIGGKPFERIQLK